MQLRPEQDTESDEAYMKDNFIYNYQAVKNHSGGVCLTQPFSCQSLKRHCYLHSFYQIMLHNIKKKKTNQNNQPKPADFSNTHTQK